MVSIVIKNLFFWLLLQHGCGASFEAEKRRNKINLTVDANRGFVGHWWVGNCCCNHVCANFAPLRNYYQSLLPSQTFLWLATQAAIA